MGVAEGWGGVVVGWYGDGWQGWELPHEESRTLHLETWNQLSCQRSNVHSVLLAQCCINNVEGDWYKLLWGPLQSV